MNWPPKLENFTLTPIPSSEGDKRKWYRLDATGPVGPYSITVYENTPTGHVWRRLSPMSACCCYCGVIAQHSKDETCPERKM